MEEDKLLRFHERLKDFLQRRLNLLLNIVIAFVILILISGAWWYYQKNREKKAFQELAKIIHQGGSPQSLQQFIKQYKGTQAGLQATLILWKTLQQGKDLSLLQKELSNLKDLYKGEAKDLPLYAEAKIAENNKNYEEALKIYQRLREKNTALKEIVMYDLARLQAKKNKEEAIKIYQTLLKEGDPESLNKGLIEYKLYELQRR